MSWGEEGCSRALWGLDKVGGFPNWVVFQRNCSRLALGIQFRTCQLQD